MKQEDHELLGLVTLLLTAIVLGFAVCLITFWVARIPLPYVELRIPK